VDYFTREELQDLRHRAEFEAANDLSNKFRQIAYLEFAAAADKLDSLLARDMLDNASLAARSLGCPPPVQPQHFIR